MSGCRRWLGLVDPPGCPACGSCRTVPSGSWWAVCQACVKLVVGFALPLGLGWLMEGSLLWRCRDCGEITSDEELQ